MVEKQPKQKVNYTPAYTDADTGFGLLAYIIMQGLILIVARGLLTVGVPYTKWFYYIYAFFVEGVFALAVLFVCWVKKRNFPVASGMKKKVSINLVGLCIGISLVCLLGLGRVSDFFMQILEWLGYESKGAGIQVTNFGELVIYTILVALMPAICEELLFRGLMLNGLAKYGKNIAVFVSAFAFMIMHGSPDQTVHQFILGVIFGYIVYYTGNLWLTIIIHFCNNFFVLLTNFVYNISTASRTVTPNEEVIATPVPVGYQVAQYILSVIIVAVSVYLIISAIKQIAVYNKKVNGVPDYVDDKDREKLKIKDEIAETDVTVEAENAIVVEKVGEAQPKSKPKLSPIAIVLLAVANGYLVVEWIIALVQGFMR